MRYLLVLSLGVVLCAVEKDHQPAAQGLAMEYGPAIHYFTDLPKPHDQTVTKSVIVRLNHDAAILFDTETLRYAGVWTGGYVNMGTTNITRWAQGKGSPEIIGTMLLGTSMGPGFAGANQTWQDPRTTGLGNLPSSWGTYHGLYRHGDQVIFSYTIGETAINEYPQAYVGSGVTWITRALDVAPGAAPITFLIAEIPQGQGKINQQNNSVLVTGGIQTGMHTMAGLIDAPAGASWSLTNGRITVTLPPRSVSTSCTIAVTAVSETALAAAETALVKPGVIPTTPDIKSLCRGGATQWPVVTTAGTLGDETWAYTVDTLTLPIDNPWKSWMRVIGMDFFSDGRLVISTMGGDVWIASGIDDGLNKITWKRFANGLFEPLGLKIVNDQVFALCRDQLVRLDDLNQDNEADYYVSFNRDAPVYPKYNAFAFDLVTDAAGNFYHARSGHGGPNGVPMHSAMIKISPDGKRSSVVATGFRVPSGLGMGPNDFLTNADNQGNWTPACRINVVKPDKWYGYVGNPKFYGKVLPEHPATYEPPLCWMPMVADNSPGAQVWSGNKWGPLSQTMFHLSYGQSSIMAVLHETVNGQVQGGVVKVPLTFGSGLMRGAVNPKDGQLYVCGLKGFQTNAGLEGCVQRVRATKTKAAFPVALAVKKDHLVISFSEKLDPDTVSADSVSVQRWNYAWTAAYGSPDFSVENPKQQGRDKVTVKQVTLANDGKSISIVLDDIKPVHQMGITMKFADTQGEIVKYTIYNTINAVP